MSHSVGVTIDLIPAVESDGGDAAEKTGPFACGTSHMSHSVEVTVHPLARRET